MRGLEAEAHTVQTLIFALWIMLGLVGGMQNPPSALMNLLALQRGGAADGRPAGAAAEGWGGQM